MNRATHPAPDAVHAARNVHVGVAASPSPHRDAPRGTRPRVRAGASHSALRGTHSICYRVCMCVTLPRLAVGRPGQRWSVEGTPPRLADTEVPLAVKAGRAPTRQRGRPRGWTSGWLPQSIRPPSTSTPGHRPT